jgi:transcriptional regulator with XRE-family HTH domain
VTDERHFGKRLREARLGAGLSQSDLEDISGIPKARLSRYENGHVEPSIQTLNRLARALNVSEASLLGDERAALEEFESVLKQRGITFKTKEQARELAETFANSIRGGAMVNA